MGEADLRRLISTNQIHKEFKLSTTFATSSMVLFDSNGILRRYDNELEILREFYPLRLNFYIKRKKYYEGMLEAEASKLENQARFILEKNNKQIVMENIKRKEFIKILIERNYDSDPVAEWKKKHKIDDDKEAQGENNQEQEANAEEESDIQKYDFNYLIDMTMRSMLRENVSELLKKRDDKKEELEKLRKTSPEQLWITDLDSFLEELDITEKKERDNFEKNLKKPKGSGKTNFKNMKVEQIYKPSENGQRIVPKVDFEKYQPKEKKERKKAEKKTPEDGETKKPRKKKDEDVSSSDEVSRVCWFVVMSTYHFYL